MYKYMIILSIDYFIYLKYLFDKIVNITPKSVTVKKNNILKNNKIIKGRTLTYHQGYTWLGKHAHVIREWGQSSEGTVVKVTKRKQPED